MSNVIQFLEQLGESTDVQSMPDSEYARCVNQLELSEQLQYALIEKDTQAINELLGGRQQVVCTVAPADDDDDDDSIQWDNYSLEAVINL